MDELKTEKELHEKKQEKASEKNIQLFSGKLSSVNGTKAPNAAQKENDDEKIILSEDETKRLRSINDDEKQNG